MREQRERLAHHLHADTDLVVSGAVVRSSYVYVRPDGMREQRERLAHHLHACVSIRQHTSAYVSMWEQRERLAHHLHADTD